MTKGNKIYIFVSVWPFPKTLAWIGLAHSPRTRSLDSHYRVIYTTSDLGWSRIPIFSIFNIYPTILFPFAWAILLHFVALDERLDKETFKDLFSFFLGSFFPRNPFSASNFLPNFDPEKKKLSWNWRRFLFRFQFRRLWLLISTTRFSCCFSLSLIMTTHDVIAAVKQIDSSSIIRCRSNGVFVEHVDLLRFN